MPIDADAYMAGHIPGLSRGGSWRPPSHPVASIAQLSNPIPGENGVHEPIRRQQVGGGVKVPFVPIHLHPQFPPNPLRSPRSSIGHPGWQSQSQVNTSSSSINLTPPFKPDSVACTVRKPTLHKPTPALMPLTPPLSPTRLFHMGGGYWPGDFWEKQSGAPKPLPAEPDYNSVNNATILRPRAESLPKTPLEHESNDLVSSTTPTTPKVRSKSTRKRESLSENVRPNLIRRHTHDPLSVPTSHHFNSAISEHSRTRHLSNPENDRCIGFTESSLDFTTGSERGGVGAHSEPTSYAPTSNGVSQGYISPLSTEGYDRYTIHPAAAVPPRYDRPRPMAGSTSSRSQSDVYIPIGYPKANRNMAPVDRNGPLMRTYGVPWSSETLPLPPEPEGPRWTVARPPRLDTVEGGWAWYQSGGQEE